MEVSKYLRNYSRTVAGKEQLVIAAMAKSLEIIPRQLCDNAGFDATNILNKLREKHSKGEWLVSSHCALGIVSMRVASRYYLPSCRNNKWIFLEVICKPTYVMCLVQIC